MARIRTVKPEFFSSRTMARASVRARLTFIGIWTFVDDEGRGIDEPRLLKAGLWPLDDFMTPETLTADLDELEALGVIFRYAASDGRHYFAVRNWKEHQRINRPQPSRIPPPPIREPSRKRHGRLSERSVNDPGTLTDGSLPERKGKEGSREQGREQGKELPAPVGAAPDGPGNWPAEASEIYAEHIGVVAVPRFGKALKPLVERYGWDEPRAPPEKPVREVLACYCRWRPFVLPNGKLPDSRDEARKDMRFCSPEDFARTYRQWAEMLQPLASATAR